MAYQLRCRTLDLKINDYVSARDRILCFSKTLNIHTYAFEEMLFHKGLHLSRFYDLLLHAILPSPSAPRGLPAAMNVLRKLAIQVKACCGLAKHAIAAIVSHML